MEFTFKDQFPWQIRNEVSIHNGAEASAIRNPNRRQVLVSPDQSGRIFASKAGDIGAAGAVQEGVECCHATVSIVLDGHVAGRLGYGLRGST